MKRYSKYQINTMARRLVFLMGETAKTAGEVDDYETFISEASESEIVSEFFGAGFDLNDIQQGGSK